MHATARRPLWVRVGAGLLAVILFLTNTVYPWISLLPAPPIVVAQELAASATDSTEATPAASVATPAPSPLDPLDQLENEILLSTTSAEIVLPEETPEATPSATPTPLPEVPPEDQISTPSASSTPPNPPDSPDLLDLPASPTNQPQQSPIIRPSDPLPPLLSPFTINLNYPFSGTHPISYGFGETSGSSYVRLMQNLFDVDAHDGVDFAILEGTEILATDAGTVLHAGPGLYGITVIIQHSWGNSYYGHLSQVSVTMGDHVETSQIIGLSGNTGVTTGPHLHFGIRPSHFDPFNGYHGMIDPLPYLNGQKLGVTHTKHDLIHLPYKTLASSDSELSIPLLATNSAILNYQLKDPRGNIKSVYPTIYNYGTGDTAILPRPNPFIPGEYTLTVTNALGESDEVKFSWGVVTLNTNQSRYTLGQTAEFALAVLDETGEMVCDADLILDIRTPSGETQTLTTDNAKVIRNLEVCKSKQLTLTPDYKASFTPSELGTYSLTLTALTPKHTFTITDSFTVEASLPYTLERLTATRIFPGNIYPVILKVTANTQLNSSLVETTPTSFVTTPANQTDFAPWVTSDDLSNFSDSPYTRKTDNATQTLTWDLNLESNQTKILGYTYDAPDESPALYQLGPISYASLSETRAWQIAVDGTDPTVGAFAPQTGVAWTSAGNANLSLRQPSPKSGDLMIAVIAIRPSASTVDTPSGWTLVDSQTGTDGGAEGADTGSVGLYWFSKVADGTEGTTSQTFTETGTTSVWIGQIIKLRSSTGTYDLSSGGYSINADATSWNGTLDTNIGLKSGDVVLIAGAQNGDLSNTSAWNIAATNVTTKSTVNEYFEGTTTTGNAVEVGVAETLIWDGNNTATPTITLTQSVAASGAVMALRIRQGSGTNRTDTWVRSAGPFAVGTTSVAPAYPHHDIGDMLILVVGSRGTTDPTPTTPTGWTLIGSSYNGGAGTFAADAGNARITTYSREATTRLTGTQSVTITSGNTATGQIYAINRDNSEGWTVSSGGGTDTTGGTGWSVTTSSISLDSASGGDVVLTASSINTDAYTYSSLSLTQTGSTISTPNEEAEYRGSTGNDMGLLIASTEVTSGSGSGAATFTMTGSGSTANAPAGATIAIKILGTAQTVPTAAVGFFTPPATWTAAGDANLTLTYPDPRNGDLMLAITAIRPAASTVNTPSGWTLVDSRTGTDGGAEAADTGSVGIYVFSKTSDGTEGTGSLAFTETGTTSVWIGNIMKVRSGTGTYSVSGSGYSLNADTVTWGATLGADIGLTSGDLVILASAQNGDLSNTSAWDISATDVTQKSTFNEHGEFGSTTGNDIEVGIASGMIWGGTNSATPTLTLTQSAAASGVVSAIRIREGSGTQRTDTWVRSASAQVVSTTTTLSLVYPEHDVGDMFVMFVSTRGTSDPTILAPDGWTSLGSYNGGAGTFGVDAGNARITAYYREATSRRWGTQAVITTTADVTIGQIIAVHAKSIDSWSIDSDGGTDTSGGTGWSTTGSGIDLSNGDGGDVILVGNSINTDAYTYTSHALSATGITFGEVTQTATYNTSSGNDSNLTIVTSRVTSGSGNGLAPTFTMTASGNTANAPTGSSLFVKVVGISNLTTVSGTANGNDGATVKLAFDSTLQAQTTTINSGTWTITDVTRPSIGTVVTVWVDNVADNLESSAATLYNAAPVSGLVLNTNVVTIGSNQDQSLSLTNLNSYDCTEDEDIMYQAASSQLKVEGDACAGSTTNSYTSEKLSILSGDTLTLGTSETITTYDFENAGTVTVTGNGVINTSHDWANTGTFTSGTSTVNLTGADSSTQTLSGNTTFYNLSATTTSNSAGRTIRYTAGTTTTVTGTWTMTGATSKILTLESSTSSAWSINPTITNVSYITVSYSTNTGLNFCASNSTDGNNNTAWNITSNAKCSTPTTQVSATSDTTTTSTTYTLLDSMTTTPGAGDYMVHFSTSIKNTRDPVTGGYTQYLTVFVNGAQVNHTERAVLSEESFDAGDLDSLPVAIDAYVSGVTGGQDISIYWKTTGGTATAHERTLVVQQVLSSEIIQSTATSSTTTTSTSDAALNSMSVTPGPGNYLVFFGTSMGSATASTITSSIYVNGSQVASSIRSLYIESSYATSDTYWGMMSQTYVSNVTAGQTIEVDWKTTAGTATALQRTLVVQRVSSTDVNQATATSTTTTTSSTDSQIDSLTLTPGSGDYLVFAGTSYSNTVGDPSGGSSQYLSLYVASSQIAASQRKVYTEESLNEGSSFPVSSLAYTTGVGGADSVTAQWRTTYGTLSGYQRNLITYKITTNVVNTAPNSPTSLTQKTTGDVTLTTGSWHNSTNLKFSATASDTDNPDTLQLCIEIDQLGTSFSNTEDSCGTGTSYVGSNITVTHTISVTDATEYHWQARVKDSAGAYSSWVSYDVNAESARDIGVDTTAPTGGTVYDGTSNGVDASFATSSLSSLSANWASINTNVSGLLRYEYSIGTSAGATNIKAWTDNSTATSVTTTGLTLQTSQLYYFNVRAVDNAGNTQTAISSNGQLVSPSLSFSITPATTTFNNLSVSNSYSDTQTTTLTTSTNAYNGYVIRAFTTDLLKNLGGTQSISNFSAGSYATPASWNGSETGFGYTSSDTTIQGSNKFASGTLYAPFSQTGPGDIVADHTTSVSGSSISNESFNITYKVKVPASQAATNYTSTVVYTATAQY